LIDSKINLSAVANPESAIICLPGRGQSGVNLGLHYQKNVDLPKTTIIAVTPKEYQWYPLPNGTEDQESAVTGLKNAREAVLEVALELEREIDVPVEKMALVGFSAGAVVAIEATVFAHRPFACTVVHSGACLRNDLPIARGQTTSLLLTHTEDDKVFGWEERYHPMKEKLNKSWYMLEFFEEEKGGHKITNKALCESAKFLERMLEY